MLQGLLSFSHSYALSWHVLRFGAASAGGGSNNCAVGAGTMLDVFMLATGLGFFVLAVGYTYACDRL